MRIRFTRAGYALAAGVAVTAALAMPAGAANAAAKPDATNACSNKCIDVSFQVPGLNYILGVHWGLATPNNLVRLVQGSNAAYKEDFTRIDDVPVYPTYCMAAGYAQTGSVFTNNQCHLLLTSGLIMAPTFQLAYNPNNGGGENLCVGAWGNESPGNGAKMRLVECGVASDTVLIQTRTLPGGTVPLGKGYWLINGGSDNFSNPLVASNPGYAPSEPTWSTAVLNGKKAIDTQSTHFLPGPF